MVRRATSQDVADLAGVSRSAVSLVLNGHGAGNIAPAKQEAIREAARALNYTPNALALSLRSQRSRTIGVLIWGGPDPALWVMLHAALRTAAALGYQLLIMDIEGGEAAEARAIATLQDRQVEGFLVMAPTPGHYRPPEALQSATTVLANCTDPDLSVTSVVGDAQDPASRAAVGHQAIRLLVEELSQDPQLRRRITVEQAPSTASGSTLASDAPTTRQRPKR
jgi:LacI family transcriptional regulator